MTARENLLRLLRRQGYEWIPSHFSMCPSLTARFVAQTGCPEAEIAARYGSPFAHVSDMARQPQPAGAFEPYYRDVTLAPGTHLTEWGVAHEPGVYHMTHMVHPLRALSSLEQLAAYPFPEFTDQGAAQQRAQVEAAHAQGLAALGAMQMTIWETAWYLRGMEALMLDLMEESPLADALLEEVTRRAMARAQSYARAGVDCLFLGDDIGTQHSLMMSRALYQRAIQPRLAQVIGAARAVKPDILVLYHSCGYVLPIIEDLIDAGVDVLNPVQPESMEFSEVYQAFGGRLSFLGGIGTQTTMPHGTPEEVRAVTHRLLELGGARGGVLPAPTHLLEPEVPVDNVLAYVDALRDWRRPH